MREPRLLLAASQLEWATAVRRHVVEHGGASLVGEAMTVDQIRSRADFDVVAFDDLSSMLSPGLVGELERAGRRVLVLTRPGRGEAVTQRLGSLGLDGSAALPADASAQVIVGRVREMTAATLVASGPAQEPAGAVSAPVGDVESGRGRRVVVLGGGGVGEVAVTLAAVFARRRVRCVVVDVDTVEPALAQRLGTPLTPNVLTVSEHLRLGAGDPAAVIDHPEGFSVVAGLANPREWQELSAGEVGELAAALSRRFEVVVMRCGSILEDVAPMMSLEGRFDADRRAVQDADEVVVVAAGGPVGLVRALTTAGDVRVLTGAPIHVAVNRAPPSRFQRGEWEEELRRSLDAASVVWLPSDRRVEAASWDGGIATRGPFWRAVQALGDRVGALAAVTS